MGLHPFFLVGMLEAAGYKKGGVAWQTVVYNVQLNVFYFNNFTSSHKCLINPSAKPILGT
jgi:hypothetical protein